MAIVLQTSTFDTEVQSETQLILGNLLWIMDTTTFPTFTVAILKAALDAGQVDAFDTTAFDQYLTRIYSLDLDTTLLTLTERSRLNTIREYLQPAPTTACCGVEVPADTNTTMAMFAQVGSATFEYEVQAQFDTDVDCAAYTIELGILEVGPAPAPVVTPVVLNRFGCVADKWVFSKLLVDFVGDPSGGTYDFDLTVKDSLGATIAAYNIVGYVVP